MGHQSIGSHFGVGTWVTLWKHSRLADWAGLFGKVIGIGVFAVLVYSYCNVLMEACIRGVH